MNAVDLPFREALDIFETGGNSGGMEKNSIDMLPVIKFNHRNLVDASDEKISCSVCLQVCFFILFSKGISCLLVILIYSLEEKKKKKKGYLIVHTFAFFLSKTVNS